MDRNERPITPRKTIPEIVTSILDYGQRKISNIFWKESGAEAENGEQGSNALQGLGTSPQQRQLEKVPSVNELVLENPEGETEVADDEECDEDWMLNFTLIRLLLLILGRWPFIHFQEKKGFHFKFKWQSSGFIIFAFTAAFTLWGLILSGYNVISILMKEKVKPKSRSNTEIIEQALLERHTIMLIIMLGSYIVNSTTSYFIFMKKEEIATTFTRWTRLLKESKISTGGFFNTHTYAGIAFLNFVAVSVIFVFMSIFRTSATVIGGPTVVSILFVRQFLPPDYLEDGFVGSFLHQFLHLFGLFLYFYVVLTCNALMYLFLWLIKTLDNAFFYWNVRTLDVVLAAYQDPKQNPQLQDSELSTKHRTSYQLLYRDHIGLVRMLSWMNNMFAYSLEPYILLQLIKIVYKMYLAALVLEENGKPPHTGNVGQYFIREKDYIPALLMMYENCFMLAAILYAAAWLEDTTYDSYDELRKKTLLKGTKGEKEAYFYLSMFQSYTSVTRMAVYAGQYFCLDRYSILHAVSAIMSNFLVVYQFGPLFDMDTVEFKDLREIVGGFLEKFENLKPNHTVAINDKV